MPLSGTGPMLKLTVLGDGGVGKTALVIQLCMNKFVETYDPTIEDSYRTRVVLDEHAITLELMDTAGQEEYVSLRDQWISEGEGFLIVYSVTDQQSFTRIKQYYEEIARIKDEEPYGVVLVGNKIDESSREVSTHHGEALAAKWGIPFFETSAKKNINTESAFMSLARLTRDNRDALAASVNNTVASVSGVGAVDDVGAAGFSADIDPFTHTHAHSHAHTHTHAHSRHPSFTQAQAAQLYAAPPSDAGANISQHVHSSSQLSNSGSHLSDSGSYTAALTSHPSVGYGGAQSPLMPPLQEGKRKKKKSKCVIM